MTDKLKSKIKEEEEKLPQEMQNAISSLDWPKIAEEIGKKYLLSESEANDFQVETMLVLTGLEEMSSYATNIEYEIGVSKSEAEKIANEAQQKIFIPIYNSLSKIIKEKIKNKSPNLEQSINFILSGGNYFAFLEEKENANGDDNQKMVVPVFPVMGQD